MKIIVAVDQNWAIGRDGNQLVYLSEDLKRFKALTLGHSVILGRKTLTTFPNGEPLKGRRNLILSRSLEFAPDGAELFSDLDSLLKIAPKDSFVVGGSSIYSTMLNYCDTAYVTKIDYAFPNADCWFPNLDDILSWKIVSSSKIISDGKFRYQFVEYKYEK